MFSENYFFQLKVHSEKIYIVSDDCTSSQAFNRHENIVSIVLAVFRSRDLAKIKKDESKLSSQKGLNKQKK
jgi:hypothetical protein